MLSVAPSLSQPLPLVIFFEAAYGRLALLFQLKVERFYFVSNLILLRIQTAIMHYAL